MKLCVAFFRLGLIALFFSCCFFPRQPKIPAFNVLMIDSSSVFNMADVPEGKPTVILFFSPDCEHCQAETESILNNIHAFDGVNLYFITSDPFERLQSFNTYYKMWKYGNVKLARDFNFYLATHFEDAAPPFLIVFDEHKVERATFSGETTAEKVIGFLNTL